MSLIRQGKFRPLAVTPETRYAGSPDVPTFKESGLPQMSIELHRSLRGAGGHAQGHFATLNERINATLRSPDLIAAMDKVGFVPSRGRSRSTSIPGRRGQGLAGNPEVTGVKMK